MLFKIEPPHCQSQSYFSIRRAIKILSGLAFFASCIISIAQAGQTNSSIVQAVSATDQLIIKYKNNADENSVPALPSVAVANASAQARVSLQFVRQLQSGAYVMQLPQITNVAELANTLGLLNADPAIEYAEADLILQALLTPNDPRYNEQWGYFESTAGVNLPSAWDVTLGAGAIVAVVDTGYRPHVDLVANILPGYDMVSDIDNAQDGDARDSDAMDPGDWALAGVCGRNSAARNSSWHGTHVAGTVAAVGNNELGVTGVAFQAKVLPVRALGRCGGYTSDIADSIIWAAGGSVTGVPANLNPADVINLSLGGSGRCGATQQNAIDIARSLGATVVVAAGNNDSNVSRSTPANCNGTLVVAAVNRSGGKASYSNFGNIVDLAAPGGEVEIAGNGILSTLNTGSTTPRRDSYAYYQGTSMATPHVSAIAAMLYSIDPSITPDQVEQTLISSTRAFPAACAQCGSGIADAFAAVSLLSAVDPTPAPTPPPATNVLQNGVAVTDIGGAVDSQTRFTIDVPANAANLNFSINGGTGDADLYVRFATEPTLIDYDCRPRVDGNSESCKETVQAGTYHIMLLGFADYAGVSLTASYVVTGNAK